MKAKKILIISSIVIVLVVFVLYGGRLNAKLETKKTQKQLDGILEQINDLYIENESITKQWNELEAQQEKLHGSAEQNRATIDELRAEYDNAKLFLMAGQDQQQK